MITLKLSASNPLMKHFVKNGGEYEKVKNGHPILQGCRECIGRISETHLTVRPKQATFRTSINLAASS